MKKFIHSAVVCMGITAVVLSVAASPFALAAGDAQAGEKLVAMCAACHGPDGNSPSPAFPKIAGLGEKYIYKQLKDISSKDPKKTSRKVVEMTGMLDGFSDQQLQDIAAYYAARNMQLAGARDIELQLNSGVKLNAEESLSLGEKIYRSGNMETGVAACAACHSPTGKGNAPAGYPSVGGQYAEYIEKQLLAFQAGDRTNDDAAVMRTTAGKMSAAEIKAVANYIAGLQE